MGANPRIANGRTASFRTICFAALTESPGAPVMILPDNPNRIRCIMTVNNIVAIGEDAAAVTTDISNRGYIILSGQSIGGFNSTVVVELNTTGPVYALGYTGGTPAILRILEEFYV